MKPIFNRAPLTPNSRAALSLGHIEPEGWLKEQLRAQADGLSGKLFDIWPDVGENCGWLGGNGDAWERAPYYLDGLVPLAWLLGDERLKQIACAISNGSSPANARMDSSGPLPTRIGGRAWWF